MAKESMKAREVKRAKLVAKYAEKRAALKKIVNTGDPVEAFEAKLLKLHRNCKIFLKTQIRFVCTTVANLLAVQKVICVSSEFHVFSSVKWHLTV